MTCRQCNKDMPDARAEFLMSQGKPITCVSCSTEKPKVCFLDYSHKTAPSLVVVGNDPESVRLAQRAFKRQR
jgi:hypothetical protein